MCDNGKPNLWLNIACFALPLACVAVWFFSPASFYVAPFGGTFGKFVGALFNPLYQLAAIGVAALIFFHSPLRRVHTAALSAIGGCSFLTLIAGAAVTFFLLTFKGCC